MIVGAMTPRAIVSAQTTNSMPPLAPSVCPNWLFVLAHASAHHGAVRWLASLEGTERHDEHLHAAFETLTQCRRAVALLQHHDAITGTSRTQV